MGVRIRSGSGPNPNLDVCDRFCFENIKRKLVGGWVLNAAL